MEKMDLGDLLRERCIAIDMPPGDKLHVLERLVDLAAEVHNVGQREIVVQALLAREEVGSTGIGNGVALPHARCPGVDSLVVAAATVPGGLDYQALDGNPVCLLFLILSPKNAPGEHLKLMAKITRILNSPAVRESLAGAEDAAAFWSILYDASRAVAASK